MSFSRALALVGIMLLLAPMSRAQPLDTTAPDTTAFRVYTHDGEPASLDALVAAMAEQDVVLIGEEHNDPTIHALQAHLLQQAFAAGGGERPVALSLEMFERDVQLIVDEYLAGLISETHFLRSSRPWQNYETDYRPMVEFAKAHGMPVIAANAPRRYVNRVSRQGPASLADLPPAAHALLPPLPYAKASPAYQAKWFALMAEAMDAMESSSDEEDEEQDGEEYAGEEHGQEHGGEEHGTEEHDASEHRNEHEEGEQAEAEPSAGGGMHGMGFMLDAQSLWDASMAYAMTEHLLRQPSSLVLHMVGGFHVERNTGIPDHLRRYRPGTRILIVALRSADDVNDFDSERHAGLGDFVILTDAALPRTYEASF